MARSKTWKPGTVVGTIAQFLHDNADGAWSISQIADGTGLSNRKVSNNILHAQRQGWVSRVSPGVYEAAWDNAKVKPAAKPHVAVSNEVLIGDLFEVVGHDTDDNTYVRRLQDSRIFRLVSM